MHTRASLVCDLRRLGVGAGDVVMVHASLRAVGPVLGGADALIEAALEAAAPGGTMMMYVGCDAPFDDVGRIAFDPADEALILEHCPAFDPATARACRAFGALAEAFRTHPGVACSANVGGRMAAKGQRADWLLAPHSLDWGYGPGTPMARLVEAGGRVLLLGSDRDQVTLLHYAETIAPVADKRTARYRAPLLEDGRRVWREVVEHDTSEGVRPWPDRYFATIVEAFLAGGQGARGRVGGAESLLLDAAPLVAFAVARMVRDAPLCR